VQGLIFLKIFFKEVLYMKSCKTVIIFSLITAVMISSAAFAADKVKSEDKVRELGTTEVTGSRIVDTIADVPAQTYVVTSSDIAKAGATNAQDALARIPGVDGMYGSQSMANSKGVTVRGFTSETLLLVDGMPYMGANYGTGASMGAPFDLRAIPVETIDRIEVVKGAGSAIYGSNAAGGVINIITKKGAQKSSGYIKTEGGNAGYFRGTVMGTAVMSDDMRVTLGYSRTLENGDVTFQKYTHKVWGTSNVVTDTYKTKDYRGNDYVLRAEKGPWALVGNFGDYKSVWELSSGQTNQDSQYRRVSLNYDDGRTKSHIYYNNFDRDLYHYYGADTYFSDKSYGIIFNRREEINKWAFTWGIDIRRDNASYSDTKTGGVKYDLDRTGFAPYIETSIPVGAANLDLGLRYEHWNIDNDEDANEFVPRISLNWENNSGTLFYATAGRYFSLPSFYQIYLPYPNDAYGVYLQNTKLKPEKGWSYELGAKNQKAKNPWNLGLFYTDMEDAIYYKYDWSVYPATNQYINLSKYRTWGVEGQIKFNINDNWSWTQGLTWRQGEKKETESSEWTRSYDPRWDLAGYLNYQRGPWSGELGIHYYADRALSNTTYYDDNNMFLVNASVAWKHNKNTLRLSCTNLFDKEYFITGSGHITPERRIIASWQYDF
jgi:outer membrane receptor protein involved in Fe transport